MITILFLIMAAIVVNRLYLVYKQYQCVSDSNLRGYLNGRLKRSSPEEYELLIAHLGLCEKCEARLHEISSGDFDTDKNLEDHLIED